MRPTITRSHKQFFQDGIVVSSRNRKYLAFYTTNGVRRICMFQSFCICQVDRVGDAYLSGTQYSSNNLNLVCGDCIPTYKIKIANMSEKESLLLMSLMRSLIPFISSFSWKKMSLWMRPNMSTTLLDFVKLAHLTSPLFLPAATTARSSILPAMSLNHMTEVNWHFLASFP